MQWIRSKPSRVTDWEAMARELGANEATINMFTIEQARAAYVRLFNAKEK